MTETRVIKRYNAYYKGWCLAFGEHNGEYEESRDINWLYAEDRIGLILSAELRKKAQHELLGHTAPLPALRLTDRSVSFNTFDYPLKDASDRDNLERFRSFLLTHAEIHMFLSSHLIYPPRTRILTFATQKPLIIMYKEMKPLRLIIDPQPGE
ncbi:MAG: hypothetical protein ABW076_15345 [Candidatus Thiodiazotropha sp.]